MKIGEYCRTDKGKIGKIVHFEPRDKYPYSYDRVILDKEGHKRTTRNIIKCSPNIIDLIEVGDIIKGIGNMIFSVIDIDYENKIISGIDFWCEEKDIKSIVTKECFESMEYKVKE